MSMRGRAIRCQTTNGNWEQLYGTTVSGNLPQHKKHHHEGHKWAQCPYDTVSSGIRSRHLTGSDVPVEGQILHEDANGRHYYMKTKSKGPRWGFECTYPGCPYEIATGKPYFYA